MVGLLRFEQDPDAPEGAGVFHFDAGEPMYAYEPELASKIGKVKGALDTAPDMRVAGPGGGEPPPPGPVAPPAPGIEVANQAIGYALADRAAQQAQPPAPAAPTAQDMAGQAREVMGQRAAADILRGTKQTYVPGSPGVDPHRMRAQGVMVPTTANEVVESNGMPYSPEAARERLTASHMVQQATLADMELGRQQTANQLASQRALAPRLEQEAARAQSEQNAIHAAYKVDRSRLQQDIDQYEKTAHVNPDRYFNDRGVFATIGLAIAQGLGAYASTMTGAPNFAFEMTQRAIDRDIAAQRDEIESGRVSRRNSLAQMMDNYGFDMGQAEAATRLAMTKSAELQAQMFANEAKLPHYQTEAAKFLALTNQENVKNEQALQNASIGKHTRSIQNAFVQPKAATGPSVRETPYTPQELAGLAKNLPAGQTAASFGDLSPEKQVEVTTKYGEGKLANAPLRQAADDWAASVRSRKDGQPLRVDWKRGVLVDSSGEIVSEKDMDVPGQAGNVGVDPDSIPLVGDRNAVQAYDEATRRVLLAKSKEAFGAATPEQVESLRPSALGHGESGAFRGLNSLIRSAHENERGLEQAYPGAVEQVSEQRERETNRRRKSGPAPVKVSDY